jgi:hypothetical protein
VRRFGRSSRAERFVAIEEETLGAPLRVSTVMKESKPLSAPTGSPRSPVDRDVPEREKVRDRWKKEARPAKNRPTRHEDQPSGRPTGDAPNE